MAFSVGLGYLGRNIITILTTKKTVPDIAKTIFIAGLSKISLIVERTSMTPEIISTAFFILSASLCYPSVTGSEASETGDCGVFVASLLMIASWVALEAGLTILTTVFNESLPVTSRSKASNFILVIIKSTNFPH